MKQKQESGRGKGEKVILAIIFLLIMAGKEPRELAVDV